jgi:cell volume regulation protein A
MFEADTLLLLVSSTLLIAYISGLIYSKTKIPDVIWNLFLGILLGPVLGFFNKDVFIELSPLMSAIALNIILFEAGINVQIALVKQVTLKATILSISTILTVIFSVGVLLSTVVPSAFNLLQGMLVGAMVGGTSTIAVYGVFGSIERIFPRIESTRVMLIMESVISDPICIIASITLIKMIMSPNVSLLDSIVRVGVIFLLSTGVGFIVGIVWAEILHRLHGQPLTYILTLAILFPTYVLTERLIGEGGGPVAALIFGLILANHNAILKKLQVTKHVEIDIQSLRHFHEEITFFIKAFFFTYMGLIILISIESLLLGIGVLVIILASRYLIVTAIGTALHFTQIEKVLTRIIYASGLPAFVMSQLPLIFDPSRQFFLRPEIYPNITMPLVLANILFAALIGPIIAKRQLDS